MNIARPQFHTLKDLASLPPCSSVNNTYIQGLEELFCVDNPRYNKGHPDYTELLKAYVEEMEKKYEPIFIYFPWSQAMVWCLPEELYFKLRTARNRNIITETEQSNFRNLKIGIAGLSVGSSILQALVISGGPKFMKLADFDVIEVSNLNRLKAGLTDVGKNKAHVAARQVWNLDPFADIEVWDNGLSADNISEFVSGTKKIDVFIDEMDNLACKVMARKICRTNHVPVVMATDNGNDVILDIERFDLEPERPLFHGSVDEEELVDLNSADKMRWIQLSTRIINPDFMTEDILRSLPEIGNSLSGVPQLGATGAIAGATVALALRRVASGYNMPSGRYTVSLDRVLTPDYYRLESVNRRENQAKTFKERILGVK